MILDAALPEHNGVYNGKWHITSLEGFNLKEGIEYLKKGWKEPVSEYEYEKPICIYIPKVIISGMKLKEALDALRSIMVKRPETIDLEIINCIRETQEPCFRGSTIYAMYFLNNIIVRNCTLTFQDIRDIILKTCNLNMEIDLSENVFNDSGKDWSQIEEIESKYKLYPDSMENRIKNIQLKDCGFSEEEKSKLQKMLQCCNVIL